MDVDKINEGSALYDVEGNPMDGVECRSLNEKTLNELAEGKTGEYDAGMQLVRVMPTESAKCKWSGDMEPVVWLDIMEVKFSNPINGPDMKKIKCVSKSSGGARHDIEAATHGLNCAK